MKYCEVPRADKTTVIRTSYIWSVRLNYSSRVNEQDTDFAHSCNQIRSDREYRVAPGSDSLDGAEAAKPAETISLGLHPIG